MQPPDYVFDRKRLDVLRGYNILDTPAEAGFDDIVRLATQICGVPVALVSLVDIDRQWFKAQIGFEPCQTDLQSSVCAHTLVEPDLLIIPDLTQDARSRNNPLVIGDPFIRFYAGAPLRNADGHVLGALCVIDGKPRPAGLTELQADGLKNLARQVLSQLELRRALAERDLFLAEQQRAEARRNALLNLGDHLRDLGTTGEMTRAAATIVGQTLNASRAAFGRLVDEDEYLFVEPDWTAEGMASIAGRHRINDYGMLQEGLVRGEPLVIKDVTLDPRTAANPQPLLNLGIRSLVNVPVRERGRTAALFLVHDKEPRAWTPEVLTFLRNVADRVEVGAARLRAEADQRVLNRELSHRMKNIFAMVQAISAQTLRSVPERDPVEAFTKRLHALSSAHDLLLQEDWSSAKLNSLIRTVLKTLAELDRFDIGGPEIELGPRATLSVSLLLHELTTNAMKYGSLSDDKGRVTINWRLNGTDDDHQLALEWQEIGGPATQAPVAKGFGSRLIKLGLVGTGGVDIRYPLSGLHAVFQAPLAQVQAL